MVFFSVIIPTLNEEKYLPKLLSDLEKQKYDDFEVIICDGFSQDKTEKIVRQSQLKKLFFFQTHLKNVATQRNFGAKKASGKYLIFLDADSRISPSFLKKIDRFIKKNPGLFFIPYLKPERKYKMYQPFFEIANKLVELSQGINKKFSLGGSMIIEKNFFYLIGGFNENLFLAEDHNLIEKAGEWGVKAKFIPSVKLVFSLRRMEREGQLKFFYKYFIATARRLILNEDFKKKIFEYEMGGHLYQEKVKKHKNYLAKYILKISRSIRKLLDFKI